MNGVHTKPMVSREIRSLKCAVTKQYVNLKHALFILDILKLVVIVLIKHDF